MELTSLKQFKRVAESGNLSKAAEELFITPAALSLSIKKLENEIGFNLFDRYKQRLYLNNNGEEFLSIVNDLLIQEQRLQNFVDSFLPKLPNNISLAFSAPSLMRFFTEKYKRAKPDSSVTSLLLSGDTDMIIDYLLRNEVDMAFTTTEINDSIISSTFLMERTNLIAVPFTSALYHKDSVNFSDLKGKQILYLADGKANNTYREYFQKQMFITGIPDFYMFEKTLENSNVFGITSNITKTFLSKTIQSKYKFLSITHNDASIFTDKIYCSYKNDNYEKIKPFILRLQDSLF